MSGTVPLAEREARAALTAVVDPGRLWVEQALADQGAEALLAALCAGRVPSAAGEESRQALQARAAACDPAALLRVAREAGGRLVVPDDAEWPPWPLVARRPGVPVGPVALWVRGSLDVSEAFAASVAVVGSRSATTYGTQVAGAMGHDLAVAGWTVASGAAYGIDGAAHRGALAAGGTTVAVLAGGVDVPYPRGHAALLARIAGTGLVVSETPPGGESRRSRFLTRNRLLSGYTGATVLVEAAVRSGALSTAAAARKLGRTVCVVPGPVTSTLSAGCHAFLRGADGDGEMSGGRRLVTRAAEVLEEIGPLGLFAPAPTSPASPLDHLEGVARAVLDVLSVRTGRTVAEVAREAGTDDGTALRHLGALVAEDLAVRDGGGWRAAPRVGTARRS